LYYDHILQTCLKNQIIYKPKNTQENVQLHFRPSSQVLRCVTLNDLNANYNISDQNCTILILVD